MSGEHFLISFKILNQDQVFSMNHAKIVIDYTNTKSPILEKKKKKKRNFCTASWPKFYM